MKKVGHTSVDEPFAGLFTQGMVVHETYRDAGRPMACRRREIRVVEEAGTRKAFLKDGAEVEIGPIEKMSKSKKNTVDPTDILANYGADTARWFVLSDSPPERDVIWTEAGVEGAGRFVQRLWRIVQDARELGAAPGTTRPDGVRTRRRRPSAGHPPRPERGGPRMSTGCVSTAASRTSTNSRTPSPRSCKMQDRPLRRRILPGRSARRSASSSSLSRR